MSVIDAFHLPDLDAADVLEWRTLERRGVAVRSPILKTGALQRRIAALRVWRLRRLAARPLAEIIAVLDRAASRLTADIAGARADDVAALTGYSPEMVRLVVERMAEDWRRPALECLLAAELDGGRALDVFVERPGRGARSLAVAPPLSVHILSGNVPGVAITSMVRALLVRSAVLAKTASGEPLLAPLFAQHVQALDPDLGRCMAVLYWAGGEDAMEAEALAEADVLVVYGGRDAVRAVRASVPAGARLVEHGPRFSIGLIAHEAIASPDDITRVADAVAYATALFDQQGCVSPHTVWVEGEADSARRVARAIAAALERLAITLPRGPIEPGAAASIRAARAATEFRSIAGADADVHTAASKGMGWTVIRESDGEFRPSPLYRTLTVQPLSTLEEAADRIAPWSAHLHTVAIAAGPERMPVLAAAMARAGATRITNFEQMPWPPVWGHHDGRGPLTELVRWVDLED